MAFFVRSFFVFFVMLPFGLLLFAGGATNSVAGDGSSLMRLGIFPSAGVAGGAAEEGRQKDKTS
jgi:hypothetical protein